MSEIVKTELMELLGLIGDLWQDIGDTAYTDLDMLKCAKNVHQKALSICRIAGCNFDGIPAGDELINDSLTNEINESLLTQQSLLGAA